MKVAFILLALLLTGCQAVSLQVENVPEAIEISTFISDKQVYSSQEDITFTVAVASPEESEVKAVVKGIKPYSRNYIEVEETHILHKGDNQLSFSSKTPYCTSGCGGVNPGEHDITLEVFKEGDLITNKTITIELTR
ncbi:MAG TPA: hypothetical protein ENN46_01865 [Candidatus Woesearchaeota archaeon]|nr:hypothetical protein [Candidatus Woesearchaeota archaeon]